MKRPNLDERVAAMAARLQSDKARVPAGAHKASCAAKDRYLSEAAAKAVAIMNGTAARLLTYRCDHCGEWHLARRHKST